MNIAAGPLIANLAMQMLTAKQQPMVGPMPEEPGRGMEVRTIYPETFPNELANIYSDWEGDPREKMVVLTHDDRIGILPGQKDRMGQTLKDFIGILARNRITMDKIKHIVHNHNKGQKISPADVEFLNAAKRLGFSGEYDIYWPKRKRLRKEG